MQFHVMILPGMPRRVEAETATFALRMLLDSGAEVTPNYPIIVTRAADLDAVIERGKAVFADKLDEMKAIEDVLRGEQPVDTSPTLAQPDRALAADAVDSLIDVLEEALAFEATAEQPVNVSGNPFAVPDDEPAADSPDSPDGDLLGLGPAVDPFLDR